MVAARGSEWRDLGNESNGKSGTFGRSPVATDEHPLGDRPESKVNTIPTSITPRLPNRNKIISIAVIDRYSFTRESIVKSLQDLCEHSEIQSFTTEDECMNSEKCYDLILYYIHYTIVSNGNNGTVLSSKKLTSLAPVIILSDTDSSDSICAAFDSGVRGYIPTISTNLELAIEILHLVKAGGIFVPLSGLSSRGVKSLATPDLVTTQFTARQLAVLSRLKLGKTNKMIAYELEMSESSVKTHIRNIMRKVNAVNRTEVVCRAHELEVTAAIREHR